MANESEKSGFLAVCLRGTSQVFFMENQLTGVLFFAAMAYASYETGIWATTIGALIGVVVASVTAHWLKCDEKSLISGLYGFNGVLVGAALPTFIAASPQLWVYIIFGAALSTVVTAAFSSTLTKIFGIPGSTGPFVLTGWLFVAGAYSFGDLVVSTEMSKLSSDYINGATSIPSAMELVQIFFRNIGQVYLLSSAVSGVLILIGIFIASVPAGIAAVLGSLVAMITAIGMGANPVEVSHGLYGYSSVLTAIAIGVIFLKTSTRVACYALMATVVTVFLQGALDVIMLPDGLPTFTAPYVLALYLFMAPKLLMAPHPHKETKLDHIMK